MKESELQQLRGDQLLFLSPHRQVTSPVQWEQTMTDMFANGLKKSYEIGPGKVVSGIAKRIDKAHNIENIVA